MKPLLDQLLELLFAELRRLRVRVPDGANDDEINDLDSRMQQTFGEKTPAEYQTLLRKINGFVIGPFTIAGTSRRSVLRSDGTPLADLEIPEAVIHAQAITIDYEPLFEGVLTLTYGPALHGWDPKKQAWFHAFYETGPNRTYNTFAELLADLLHDCPGMEAKARALMPTDFRFSSTDEHGNPYFGTKLP